MVAEDVRNRSGIDGFRKIEEATGQALARGTRPGTTTGVITRDHAFFAREDQFRTNVGDPATLAVTTDNAVAPAHLVITKNAIDDRVAAAWELLRPPPLATPPLPLAIEPPVTRLSVTRLLFTVSRLWRF